MLRDSEASVLYRERYEAVQGEGPHFCFEDPDESFERNPVLARGVRHTCRESRGEQDGRVVRLGIYIGREQYKDVAVLAMGLVCKQLLVLVRASGVREIWWIAAADSAGLGLDERGGVCEVCVGGDSPLLN